MITTGESNALNREDSPAPGLELALRCFQRGCLADAEQQLRLMEEAEPSRAEVAALRGQVLRAARRWPEAIACFEQALAPWRILGWPTPSSTTRTRPSKPCARPLQLDPVLPEALDRLGVLLVKLGRLSEAETCFATLQTRHLGDLQALGNRAMACQAGGLLEQCLAQLEAGRAIAPADWSLTYGLVFACSTVREALLPLLRQTARQHWQRLRETLPPALEALFLSFPTQPLRVADLTAERGNHAVSCFLESLLRHLDRNRLQVELIETQARFKARSAALRALAHHSFLLPERDQHESRKKNS